MKCFRTQGKILGTDHGNEIRQDWVKFSISCVVNVFLLAELRANTPDIENVLIFMAILF